MAGGNKSAPVDNVVSMDSESFVEAANEVIGEVSDTPEAVNEPSGGVDELENGT